MYVDGSQSNIMFLLARGSKKVWCALVQGDMLPINVVESKRFKALIQYVMPLLWKNITKHKKKHWLFISTDCSFLQSGTATKQSAEISLDMPIQWTPYLWYTYGSYGTRQTTSLRSRVMGWKKAPLAFSSYLGFFFFKLTNELMINGCQPIKSKISSKNNYWITE